MSRLLKLVIAGSISSHNNGTQQWPKIGNQANFVLIDASYSVEAVSRFSPVK
ncbi:MAG: hypothetical protein KBT58_01730 [Bizionia sp.]|nr:hypothetical protein [Bizionia sp.]